MWKKQAGKQDNGELGEGLILSRVPWEGLMEKLIFEERPDTGKGATPVAMWRRNAPGQGRQGRDPEAETEVGADPGWLGKVEASLAWEVQGRGRLVGNVYLIHWYEGERSYSASWTLFLYLCDSWKGKSDSGNLGP